MRAAFALCALILLVAAFALLAPARLIDARVAAASNGRVRLAEAEGTVWHGRGVLADAQGRWRVPVAWQADPLPLARGTVALTLLPTVEGGPRGVVLAEGDAVSLRDLHLELPAAAVESAWTRPPAPRLDGSIVVDAPAFRTDGLQVDGSFDVRWSRARIGLAGIAASLGTVEAHARPAEDGMIVALANTGGDVALHGNLTWRDGRAALDATLAPAPGAPAALSAALRALGPADADGTVHLAWQARR